MKTVVFDIGGVLVDWRPHLAWMEELGTREAVEAFMARVDFMARNTRADAGERFVDMAAEIDDPEDRRRLSDYVTLFPRAVEQAMPGTWAVLDRLLAQGRPLHAITNWSAETWPRGLTAHPRLGQVFGTTVVSGVERLVKPDPRIFHLLCERAGLTPEDCVFIDDSTANIESARAMGMDAIRFTDAAALERALVERGLLPS